MNSVSGQRKYTFEENYIKKDVQQKKHKQKQEYETANYDTQKSKSVAVEESATLSKIMNMYTSGDKQRERWAEYFRELPNVQIEKTHNHTRERKQNVNTEPPSREELIEAINCLENH